jgi:hypothetical protein
MKTIEILEPNEFDYCPKCGYHTPEHWGAVGVGINYLMVHCRCRRCGHEYNYVSKSGKDYVAVTKLVPETEGEEICRP